jgi:alkyl hydroperoxide reductase subunit AhpF
VQSVPIFRVDEEVRVRDLLADLERDVELRLVLGPEAEPVPGAREIDFSGESRRLVEEVAALAERVSYSVVDGPAFPVDRFPAICVLPEGRDVGLRYYGLPWGYELTSLVGACLEAGRRESSLRAESLEALASLDQDLSVDVFVTPT